MYAESMEKNWKSYTLLGLIGAVLVGALVFTLIGPNSYVASYIVGVIAGVGPLIFWYVWNSMQTGMQLIWVKPEAITLLLEIEKSINRTREQEKVEEA